MLATTVEDEDHSVTIVEREDILQETVKTRPRANYLVATIAANPGTQRRSADRNNETSSSQRAKANRKCQRRGKERMIEQDEVKGYKHTPLRKYQLRHIWLRTAT